MSRLIDIMANVVCQQISSELHNRMLDGNVAYIGQHLIANALQAVLNSQVIVDASLAEEMGRQCLAEVNAAMDAAPPPGPGMRGYDNLAGVAAKAMADKIAAAILASIERTE